jgi:DNA-binding transcriptional LysR family regulator
MYSSKLPKLKLAQLRTLVTVAHCGNFSEAALVLDLSQSTVSHAIATLEEELGVVLLQRGRHGARLTPVGERIVAHAQQILDILEALISDAEQAKGVQGGTVRIAAFRSVATHILPQAIAHLHRRYPTITITIDEKDELHQLKQALLQGEVDVCVAEILDSHEFESVPIFEDEYIALLPPQTNLSQGRLTLTDLQQHPLIISSHDSCADRIHQQLQSLEQPLTAGYRIRHDSSMVSMVRQGLGIAILPRLAAAPVPEDVQVYQLPFALSRPIGATMLRDALHTPALYAFLEALQAVVGSSS